MTPGTPAEPLMILVAGPYRSGTNGDPARIQANVDEMNADAAIFHPIAEQILARCDACLRIGGPSEGADRMVSVATRLGRQVYFDIAEVP